MAEHKVTFVANPTQKTFIQHQGISLFACRVGEGKSAALCWAAFHFTQHNPGARLAIIRDTWENMQQTTQKEFYSWFPDGVFGTWRATTKTFKWNPSTGLRGEIIFMGMDDERDATKLQSMELGGFLMDEPAPAAEGGGIAELVFDLALSRLRQKGMNWYIGKLAENNPDESHWTYRRFVSPGTDDFRYFQTIYPENVQNLPPGYYEQLARRWAHRPDLKRRFLEGRFGFQQLGRAVTPEWSDELHLTADLQPIKGPKLQLLWDFGLNPTCIISQVVPSGNWHIIEAHVGEGIGVYELIQQVIKPRLTAEEYRGLDWRHIGDPAGETPEQSSSANSAVKMIKKELGGPWLRGPVDIPSRVEPLRARLGRQSQGRGVVLVDKDKAKAVWHALRGGWHYPVSRSGIASPEPVKNDHSHPGDAMGYGAARLYPLGKLPRKGAEKQRSVRSARFHEGQILQPNAGPLGFERPGLRLPKDGHTIDPRNRRRSGSL